MQFLKGRGRLLNKLAASSWNVSAIIDLWSCVSFDYFHKSLVLNNLASRSCINSCACFQVYAIRVVQLPATNSISGYQTLLHIYPCQSSQLPFALYAEALLNILVVTVLIRLFKTLNPPQTIFVPFLLFDQYNHLIFQRTPCGYWSRGLSKGEYTHLWL